MLLYEDRPRYDTWFKLLVVFIPTLVLTLGFLFLYRVLPSKSESGATIGASYLFAVAAFDSVLFWAITPRKFQVFEDKLKIVLGNHLSFSISFDTIKEARRAAGRKALAYWGLRFTTSTRNVVEIMRSKGVQVVISPDNADLFLLNFNKELSDWKYSHGGSI